MLVITRKVGQSIVIGNRVVVTVLRHGKTRVQLGVDAPTHVRIARGACSASTATGVPENRQPNESAEADAKKDRVRIGSPPTAA